MRGPDPGGVDLTARVGSVVLPNPVMTASGTSGHGAELAAYFDLSQLGAVVVKSLAAFEWPGNAAPRLHPTRAGMLNAVGLQGPGIETWQRDNLPALIDAGARVVASIWGRSVDEFARAAELLASTPPAVVAVEVNLSCPNLEDRRQMFAHSCTATREVVQATASCGRPRWAKLSPNVADIVSIASAALDAGADAVTLVNTVLGLALDPDSGRPLVAGADGRGGAGLSGAAIHPIAVRAVHDVRARRPKAAIVGVGGVMHGRDAAELMLAGADAVQVGTATFADPRAPVRVRRELAQWAADHGLEHLADAVGAAHRGGLR